MIELSMIRIQDAPISSMNGRRGKSAMKLVAAVMVAVAAVAVVVPRAEAGLVVSVEAPGVQSTQVAGAITETFNNVDLWGHSTLSTAVGNISSGGQFYILNADQYGGADGTGRYIAFGAQSGSAAPLTLTFATPQAYFGFWWSAADAYNEVTFYSGNQSIGSFNTPFVLNALGQLPNGGDYFGNPNGLGDASEPFAYMNFVATGGTTISSIVFANSGTTGTGFESDNWSISAVAPEEIPGTVIVGGMVPEPSSIVLAGMASIACGLVGHRRRMRRRRPGPLSVA